MTKVDLSIGIKQRSKDGPPCWILIVADKGATRGRFYYRTGCKEDGEKSKFILKRFQRLDRESLVEKHHLATIEMKSGDKDRLTRVLQSVNPMRCQWFVLLAIRRLELVDIVPQGTFDNWVQKLDALA